MRNIQNIIDAKGGMAALKSRPIRLEVPGFMRLVIEHIGRGPRGGELVSVAHYGEQNGDLMRDPEIVFEVVSAGWYPISIQQDYVGSFQEAVFTGQDGKVYVRPALIKDIQVFTRIWDKNLAHQGFLAAARAALADN
jgi:hypothetical protein